MTGPPATIAFEFRGKAVEARAGDTVASALYRSGQRIFTRSFKYHRPRGLLCLSGRCPNCMMNVDGVPNVRVCMTPVRAGLRVRHQNASPSLEHDRLAIVQRFDWLMPVGWYYKALTHPVAWHAAEPFIRKVAGLGEPPPPGSPDREYEHSYRHTDVAIIGGGPAGVQAAVELAAHGDHITLIDDQPALGGHLRYTRSSDLSAADLIARVRGLSNVEVMQGCYCFGLYEGNLLGVVQPNPHPAAAERLIHLRAGRVIVATGAYEAPLLFPNNDLVGIMLSSAVQRLVHLHGVAPGQVAVVIGGGRQADIVGADVRGAGVRVAATVPPESVVGATGSWRVTGLETRNGHVGCDLVVVCGHRVPDAGLLTQAGARLEWDGEKGAFIPVDLPSHVAAVGDVTGASLVAASPQPSAHMRSSKRAFVCLCSDVSATDIQDAIGEGFDHIETVKRYTTATMGPCQGRMCQLSAIGICAAETHRSMDDTGITTARPPSPSVTLGALAGPRHHPIRRTPMHYEHDAQGAAWMDMGEWKRPRFYKTRTCSDEKACVEEEYRAVRERVGLIDVSTLGKLDVKGRDVGKLLDKVYAGRLSDLRPGRVRYSVMCDDAGIMLDDGTVSRLADDHFFITTTTGNLEFVQQWLEWWLIGAGWDVYITNVTGGLAAVNLAGPKARDVLATLTDCDLTTKAFPYMACRRAAVAGVEALLMRIGFVGETGWEVHFAAESGAHLWTAMLEAGRKFDIRPFGVEAQRLLRLEKRHVIVGADTDALTNPFEAGMAWAVKLDKEDFIGRVALQRLAIQKPNQNLVGFVMNGGSLPEDGAAILVDGKLAGRVTSARYSPVNRKAVGLAWVPTDLAREGAEIDVRIDGRLVRAHITQRAFYDPEGARLRM
jgi:sarcosine oxidase, subunit alpha